MTWDPYRNLVRMAASPADVLNLHGTERGLFLGPGIPLIAITLNKNGATCFTPTPQAELESWLGIAYGGAVDLTDHMPILEQVAAAYNRGALVQALITAARVRLPPLDRAGLERLAYAGLIKANFNPNEPRDGHGRWTMGGDSTPPNIDPTKYSGSRSGSTDHSLLYLINSINGFTHHGINQVLNRGVSPSSILDAIINPLRIAPQPNGTVRYYGNGAVVVLNPARRVVTVWGQ